MFKRLRIAVLLLILLFVALNTYFDRVYSTNWNVPLRVALYPINGDGSDVAERYITQLDRDSFLPIEAFFENEAKRYGVTLDRAVRVSLGKRIDERPPALGERPGMLAIMGWSLRARYWAWRVPPHMPGPAPDVKLFVLFHDPQTSPSLPHSTGLQKGLFGIVYAFADRRMAGSNDVVISHELLHTLGATDKYDLQTSQPKLPDGYADPQRQPLYPQVRAELMGGRIPESPQVAQTPASLRPVIVGPLTAREIGWTKE